MEVVPDVPLENIYGVIAIMTHATAFLWFVKDPMIFYNNCVIIEILNQRMSGFVL